MGNFFKSLFLSKPNRDLQDETGDSNNKENDFDVLKYDGVRAQRMGKLVYAEKCFRAAIELLAAYVPRQLKQGHTVKVPGLGTFRISFKSRGADTPDAFNVQEMIYDVRIIFIPEAGFREQVLLNFEFVDGGVREDGVDYASREAYKKAKSGQSA